MYNWIATHIFARFLDFFRGTRTMQCLDALEQSQWWPKDKLLELPHERLRRLLSHAYDTVPYYRKLFDERSMKPDDIKDSRELAALPVLTKQLIRNNFDNLKSSAFSPKETVLSATSGSTGSPLRFYSTKEDQLECGFARGLRAHKWAGYELGEKAVVLYPPPRFLSKPGRLGKRLEYFFKRHLVIDPVTLSKQTMPLFVRRMEVFQPSFIIGYPSAIYVLARFIKKNGRPDFSPKAVMAGGEQLDDHHRELFEEVFGCETYGNYGSWEAHTIAAECPEHTGYHIAAEDIIVEIVNDAGEPVPSGTEGKILLTNLHNYAMPLIRYDIGDTGAISSQPCTCGRGLPLLLKLSGRIDDVIVTRSGRTIPGIVLPKRFLAHHGVEQHQLVQDSYDRLIVKLVLDEEYTPEYTDKLNKLVVAQYQSILGEDIAITVQFVDRIVTAPNSKGRVVISNLPTNKVF
ncbi:MAG: phenylacetate--CoA ligase family protein [Chloroflexota bacterium]|nr:MAG: phenylacetate--CoA ligase family protein [Chloroflexota bacterium]